MFYIYENWQAGPHKAKIHRASCAYCNDGHGLAGGYDPAHGRWHGPFDALELAETFMATIRAKDRRPCQHCLKVAS